MAATDSPEMSIEEMRATHDKWCVVCTHTGYRCAEKRLLGEVDRLREFVAWIAREPCQYVETGDGRCSDMTDLNAEERCLPCQARIEADAHNFRTRLTTT